MPRLRASGDGSAWETRERGRRAGLASASGILGAALAVWLAASPPAGAQGADRVDEPAREAAGKWANDLFGDIRTRAFRSTLRAAVGGKLALQPLDPRATGLRDRHRWQVYDWMVNALQEAVRDYTVVDRARVEEVYRAMERSGPDSDAVMARYLEVLKKQGAGINVTCRSNPFGGEWIVLNCLATDIENGTNLGRASVSFLEGWLPLASLDYALNVVAGKVAAKLGGLEAGRMGEVRIVEESAGGETRLLKYVARTLVTEISGRMGRHPKWQGIDAGPEGPVYRLEGELLQLDERKLEFHVLLFRGDTRVDGIREVIALATVPPRLLERTPAPGPDESAEAARAEEASLGLGYADRVLVQRGLAASGFEVGASDGIFGGRTREVVALWQVRRGLEGTGYLTRDQADALMAAAREAEAKEP